MDLGRSPLLDLWLLAVLLGFGPGNAWAQEASPEVSNDVPQRPVPLFNRWAEDWSVLSDDRVPREPFDDLKYISLSSEDALDYLSLGANARERLEILDAAGFGTGSNRDDSYLISRLEAHADLHWGRQLEFFAQLQSDYAVDKTVHTPADQDRLSLEQGFVLITEPLGDGELAIRLGRQQIAFDLQRFISVRDGPNVRQSYDGAWLEYKSGPWRVTGVLTHPVENRDEGAFSDYSSPHLTYNGLKIERDVTSSSTVSVLYAHFIQDDVRFPSVSGDESRDIVDLRYAGTQERLDWDYELMGQGGSLGAQSVRAWAVGTITGYTLEDLFWTPRLGFQLDAASGDKDPHDSTLNTFNPLFPNGYYVTLSGLTGYVNFVHAKASLTVDPISKLKVLLAVAGQWRETTADAIYTQPDIPIANTAGHGGSYTGTYVQTRLDWSITPQAAIAIEAVHFVVGQTVIQAGGHNSNYLGVEVRFAW
jgi:hypothetical protein